MIGRAVYATLVLAGCIWLLRSGQPLGGLVLLPLVAIAARRSAESGRLSRLLPRR